MTRIYFRVPESGLSLTKVKSHNNGNDEANKWNDRDIEIRFIQVEVNAKKMRQVLKAFIIMFILGI